MSHFAAAIKDLQHSALGKRRGRSRPTGGGRTERQRSPQPPDPQGNAQWLLSKGD